jgi:hypothetical protein
LRSRSVLVDLVAGRAAAFLIGYIAGSVRLVWLTICAIRHQWMLGSSTEELGWYGDPGGSCAPAA